MFEMTQPLDNFIFTSENTSTLIEVQLTNGTLPFNVSLDLIREIGQANGTA